MNHVFVENYLNFTGIVKMPYIEQPIKKKTNVALYILWLEVSFKFLFYLATLRVWDSMKNRARASSSALSK